VDAHLRERDQSGADARSSPGCQQEVAPAGQAATVEEERHDGPRQEQRLQESEPPDAAVGADVEDDDR